MSHRSVYPSRNITPPLSLFTRCAPGDPLGGRKQTMACLEFYVHVGYQVLLPNKRSGKCRPWCQRDTMLDHYLCSPPDFRRKLPIIETSVLSNVTDHQVQKQFHVIWIIPTDELIILPCFHRRPAFPAKTVFNACSKC